LISGEVIKGGKWQHLPEFLRENFTFFRQIYFGRGNRGSRLPKIEAGIDVIDSFTKHRV